MQTNHHKDKLINKKEKTQEAGWGKRPSRLVEGVVT